MRITDEGTTVRLDVTCVCGHRLAMVADGMDGVEGLARASYVLRMERKAKLAVIRHCRLGASTLN